MSVRKTVTLPTSIVRMVEGDAERFGLSFASVLRAVLAYHYHHTSDGAFAEFLDTFSLIQGDAR